MPVLTLTTYISSAPGLTGAMIADLDIIDPGGGAGPTLYATTGYNGSVSAWDLTASGPVQINTSRHTRTDVPGTTACLGFVNTAQGPALLTGGGSKGALVLRDLDNNGGLGTQQNLGTLPSLAGDLISTITVTLSGGAQVVYGGLAGASGVGQLNFSVSGTLTGSGVTPDTAATAAGRVVALAEARVGGQQYLFTASSEDVGITCWTVSSTGALVASTTLNSGNGLWIGTPTAMDVTVVAGQTYLVLAAAGSNTLSLVAVASNGSMSVTDNVMDDLNSRFAGATAMTVVEHGGQSYVIAGGGDDGISLYQILPGGQFLALAHLADTAAMGLSDVSAIAAQSTPTGIEIFVGSSSETGITQLKYDPGPAGQTMFASAAGSTLTGGNTNDVMVGAAGNDRLSGGSGSDILMDGAGSDTLTGGSGADIFVLTSDGVADTITDFTLGSDTIDLSGWNLRGISQLTLTATATGLQISFGTEVLVVNSSTGGSINPASLTEADLLNLTRLGVVVPTIAAPPSSSGSTGNDLLFGSAYADTLRGEIGNDSLYGGDGNDRLDGGPNGDLMEGGLGNDIYVVDDFWDVVVNEIPGGGIDTIESWVSYWLSDNIEILQLQGSADINGIGTGAGDTIIGNSGGNVLEGLAGSDSLSGGAGSDVLVADVGNDTLQGDSGNDSLFGQDGNDVLDGGINGDLMDGAQGNDTYVVDDFWDVIVNELPTAQNGGLDTVLTSVDFTLPANVEILQLQGSAAINGVGTSGADTLVGNSGPNVLDGQAGNDRIDGGSSNDTLIGGAGADTLIGGAWQDTFIFTAASDSKTVKRGSDLISGFETGADCIDLSRIDANTLLAGDQAFRFIGRAGFSGSGSTSAGELRIVAVNSTTVNVEVDINGDRVADMRIQVTGIASMTSSDFIL